MKKLMPLLLAVLLLLSGCSLEALLAMETHEDNPISSATTVIIFGDRDENGPVRVVTDEATIAALMNSYQWTHDHMRCCLEGTVECYIDFIEGDRLAPWDVGKDRLYQKEDVLAYNAAFRTRLRAAYDSAVPMYRQVVQVDSAARLGDVRAALPGCIAACGQDSSGTTVHILTPLPLTETESTLLRTLPGVTLP